MSPTAAALAVPRVIGHRGAAAEAPENTIAAFRAAAAAGAGWVELDAKLAGDGTVIVMHDDRLDRTTDGRGPVAGAGTAEIARLDAGRWFAPAFAGERVPTLAEVCRELASLGLGVNVEIKPCKGREAETAAAVCSVLRQHWSAAMPAPLLSSFRRECLAVARVVAPEFPRGFLAEVLPADWQSAVQALECVAVHLGRRHLMPEQVVAVRASGLPVLVWTVNDTVEAKAWIAAGAVGIITDDPASLASALAA